MSLGQIWFKTLLLGIGVGVLVHITGGPDWACVALAVVTFLLFLILHILYRISDDLELVGRQLARDRDESEDDG